MRAPRNNWPVRLLVVGTVVALVISACGDDSNTPEIDAPSGITVKSSAFGAGEEIPIEFTCDGADVSPPLEWSGGKDAGGVVVTLTDPDAGGYVHWVVLGIPDDVSGLQKGAVPPGATEATNDFGETGYGGPCPPEGDEPQRYAFTVYRLTEPIEGDLSSDAALDDVLDAIECCVAAKGTLIGKYGR